MHFASLGIATDIDVLPTGAIVEDRDAYVVVRTPSNPTHYWGNFLVYRAAPTPGDRERWERDFDREVGSRGHVALTWDSIDGAMGAAREEFGAAGYEVEESVALVAAPDELLAHARASDEVQIRRLDPAPGADEALWVAAEQLQVDNREPGHTETDHRAFVQARQADRRQLFRAGRGGWFVAVTPDGDVAAACGIVVTDGRARYQSVDTAEAFRRRGIASRLVHDVGVAAVRDFRADRLVIVADANYHALALYESLGFVSLERTVSACWWPGAPRAAQHPTR
ncbi:MAG: GCN5-related N-acetyltransferase [Thermoleophilia bacterium]|nr:GCN5-related N-acetyltransferase [Thermoleophilia bacterium]